MREIVLDTETTGIDPSAGHRIIEIGALELFNQSPTGEQFHIYINPEREIDAGAVVKNSDPKLYAPDGIHPFGTVNACVFFSDGTFLEPLAIGDAVVAEQTAREGNAFTAGDARFRTTVGDNGFSALVLGSGDADADDLIGKNIGAIERLLDDLVRYAPDHLCIVLDPARLGVVVGKLDVVVAHHLHVPIQQKGGGTRGSLVNREHQISHASSRMHGLGVAAEAHIASPKTAQFT